MNSENNLTAAFMAIIQRVRKSKKLSLEQLADLAQVHRTTIGLLEKGKRTPTLQMALRISSALNLSLSDIIREAEMMNMRNSGNLRQPSIQNIRNENKLREIIGLTAQQLLDAIQSCYDTLDTIDAQLINKNVTPIGNLVELANFSSMIGNLIGEGIAKSSAGIYARNKPHTYHDLLPQRAPAVNLELKMALETNKPKGHLPKPGTYITFRYVLGDKKGNFNRGKDLRGDTAWIWEVKVGRLTSEDFSCSNTDGDSGKTAVIKTNVHNQMPLVYYVPEFLPYAPKNLGEYVGFN